MGLVEIVNPNGRKGLVAEGSAAAKAYKRSPSTREEGDAGNGTSAPGPTPPPAERPGRNASRDDWHSYAVAQGADPDALTDLSRDQIADTYGQEA